jgi:hypothetical protein
MAEKLYTIFEAAAMIGVPKAALVAAVTHHQVPAVLSYRQTMNGFNRKAPVYMITKEAALEFKQSYEERVPYADQAPLDEEEAVRKKLNKSVDDNRAAQARKRLEAIRDAKELGLSVEELDLL